MSPDKGAHRAIAVAIEAGLPLQIAGKCGSPPSTSTSTSTSRRTSVGDIEYLGEVLHGEKVELLQTRARRSSRSSGRSRSAS